MGIKGLDHDNINTSNMKDTMGFYTDLLDFTDGFRPPFDFPGAWLYAWQNAGPRLGCLNQPHNLL